MLLQWANPGRPGRQNEQPEATTNSDKKEFRNLGALSNQGKPSFRGRSQICWKPGRFPNVKSGMLESDNAHRNECVLQLAQRISRLPWLQKKVLAMCYFENLPLADIATCLGLSKIRACQILGGNFCTAVPGGP